MITNYMWSPRRQGGFPKISARNCSNPQLRKKGELDKPCVFAIVLLTVQSSACEFLWGQNAQDNGTGFLECTGTVLSSPLAHHRKEMVS